MNQVDLGAKCTEFLTQTKFRDIIEGIIRIDPFDNTNEGDLIQRVLSADDTREQALENFMKLVGPSKAKEIRTAEQAQKKLDKLKSSMSKAMKENFKKNVKALCNIEVFKEHVATHIPEPSGEIIETALHQDLERMLVFFLKRKEMSNLLLEDIKALKEIVESKGPHSERAKKRRILCLKLRELTRALGDIVSGISQIDKALKSIDGDSKVAYAKMIKSHFEGIKAKLLTVVNKTKKLKSEVNSIKKEKRKRIHTTPDFIDEECEVCIECEKSWDHKNIAETFCEPLTVQDAKDFHKRLVRSGGMRGLVEQIKSLLECENTDPEVALPTLLCSMTDPKRAETLYNLISENNFLKDFKHSLEMDSKHHRTISIEPRRDCSMCGVPITTCSFTTRYNKLN